MTESIMSTDDDKKWLDLMKRGQDHEGRGSSLGRDGGTDGFDHRGGKCLSEKVADLVENVDELSIRAQNMKLTRSEFLNCLRDVTKVKILSIKEAKDIFEVRVKKLLQAQHYEIKSQELFGLTAAQDVFLTQA